MDSNETKVYIVMEDSTNEIRGVFSTRNSAEKFAGKLEDFYDNGFDNYCLFRVEEYKVFNFE